MNEGNEPKPEPRYKILSEKKRQGTLSASEEIELDNLWRDLMQEMYLGRDF